MHRVWLPLLISMAACGRHGEENLGLSGQAATIDVAKLTQPEEQVREAGTANVAGHPGVKLALAARTAPDGAKAESEPGKKWREKMAVRYIDGDVVLDAKSGAPLAVRIETQYTFVRDGKPVSATVAYKQTTGNDAGTIAAPADWTTVSRPRPMLDKQTLLEGLK